ncbi:MAG: 16S rRNA (cytidine(1402)-2'-O)-methyltransferase [Pseudomonadota bacterium]
MSQAPQALAPGLYIVSTPIGNARDITLRALDTLSIADVLAAEDTRSLRRLMEIHGIPRSGRDILPYHDHNGATARPKLLGLLRAGKSVAYASEAGTPLVSDPGFDLVRAARAEDLPVFSNPGASAALAALTVAGLPSDRFLFAGFPPAKGGARSRWLSEIATQPATVILYESARRIPQLLDALTPLISDDRDVALCRELTKRFEEVLRGPIGELKSQLKEMPQLRGECVLLIAPYIAPEPETEDVDAALINALETLSVKDAARAVANALNIPRREAYNRAQVLKKGPQP